MDTCSDEQHVTEGGNEPDDTWFDRREVSKKLGVSPATVRRWERENLLTGRRKPGTRGGKIVYDPEEVARLAESPAIDVADEDEMRAKDLVAATVAFASQSSAHAERLLQLVEEPANQLQRMLMEENRALRERIHQLEELRIQDFDKMEDMRSKQHQRELEQLQWASRDQRKTAMLNVVIENAPKLMNQIVASGGGPQMVQSLTGLAQSLRPDQIASLMGILDPDQAKKLGTVLDTVGTETNAITSTSEEPKTHALLKED